MKKKLSCLILSVMLALTSLFTVSCTVSNTDKDEETDKTTTSRNPMTLTLWIPTDESTTSEAISQVESALNKITQPKYNTAIELHAISSDKYEDSVNARMEEINEIQTRTEEEERARKKAEREARQNGETIAETTVATEETAAADTSGEGAVSTIFPAVTSTQMDIFLVRGYDNYFDYVDNALLSSLDDQLNGSCKLMKSYIYPTFLEAAKIYEATYSVPNSHPVGKYTYLLINKELCDSYYYDPESLDSILACEDFILDVAEHSNVTPLLSAVDATGLTYWGNNGDFSVLATIVTDDQDPTSKLNIRNIFGLKSYVNTTVMMKDLKEAGAIGTNPNAKEFGVGVITGTAEDIKDYEDDYYINVIRRPRATTDDVFQAMFAVSTYTKDVTRSMEIINLLNTDSTFRTILQYGVEGVHWEIDSESSADDPYIKLLSDDYKMNLVETGNVFITYPGEGIPMSEWQDGIQQNLDSVMDPLIKFVITVDEDNEEYYKNLAEVSADIQKRVEKMTANEFQDSLESLKDEVSDSDAYFYLTDDKADGYESLIQAYASFYNQTFKNK